jgi:hypothetical protein
MSVHYASIESETARVAHLQRLSCIRRIILLSRVYQSPDDGPIVKASQ